MLSDEQIKIKENVNRYFNELDSALISLAFAKNKNETEKIDLNIKKIENILDEVHNKSNKELSDAFTRLLIAEYKEHVYESIFHPHFDKMDFDVLCEYDLLIESKKELYDTENHIHEPTHFIFDDGKHYYSFYEMFEINGHKILDKWNSSEYEYEYDDYYDY